MREGGDPRKSRIRASLSFVGAIPLPPPRLNPHAKAARKKPLNPSGIDP